MIVPTFNLKDILVHRGEVHNSSIRKMGSFWLVPLSELDIQVLPLKLYYFGLCHYRLERNYIHAPIVVCSSCRLLWVVFFFLGSLTRFLLYGTHYMPCQLQ